MSTGSDSVRVLIAGGGTAGHLLPGLAVAGALVDADHGAADVTFAGGDRGVERDLVPTAGFALTELPGRGIQRRLTVANLSAVAALLRGLVRGVGLVRRTRPDVVVVLGGYASFACGVGAVLTRRPLVLLEQNARAALQVADQGYVLETGRVTMQGDAASLAADARIVELYLGG